MKDYLLTLDFPNQEQEGERYENRSRPKKDVYDVRNSQTQVIQRSGTQ